MMCDEIILGAGGLDWQLVEHLSFVATIIGALVAWKVASRKREHVKVSPDPIRTRRVPEKATEDNCKQRYEWAMEAIETVSQANDAEHKRLYDQIDVVERRGEDKLQAAVKDVNKTIMDMPEKIIGLLSKTGQLKDHNRPGI